ncbi:hypothetical protein ACFQL1_10910 [Halomicroarcula sp. GCM10025709]|uniref:hypothetical protein n=1 Tax=Haloarcula TaxID=2237 RepID=UPI0024C30194|nr:hypothetical protein [Halomicroarcula sp. YJ-61-S]
MNVHNEPAIPQVTTEDRGIANAQGALDVVQATSVTVDEEIAAIDERAGEQATDAADQTLLLRREDGQSTVELRTSPVGTTGVRRSVTALSAPPFLRIVTR